MAYQLVTCPETARVEIVEHDETPCGTLILGCSSFGAHCAMDCPRTCAARLDRRRDREPRAEGELEERVLEVGDDLRLDVLGALRAASGGGGGGDTGVHASRRTAR
ncbi:MAG TPA: hypothetical protein VN253_12690 [Kofleriaceae bacterium]|nr:hypothetical protein [Kofleriaceae bacterium]